MHYFQKIKSRLQNGKDGGAKQNQSRHRGITEKNSPIASGGRQLTISLKKEQRENVGYRSPQHYQEFSVCNWQHLRVAQKHSRDFVTKKQASPFRREAKGEKRSFKRTSIFQRSVADSANTERQIFSTTRSSLQVIRKQKQAKTACEKNTDYAAKYAFCVLKNIRTKYDNGIMKKKNICKITGYFTV